MEGLNPDEKIQILLNLPGNEIFYVCMASKNMMKICQEKKYDSLWKKKILEEFHIEYKGKEAFQKYAELATLYSRKFYIVSYTNTYSPTETTSDIFISKKDAIEFIAREVSPIDINYFVARRTLQENDELEVGSGIYLISEKKLMRQEKKENDDVKEHNKRMEKIKQSFPKSEILTDELLEDYLIEIYAIMENKDVENLGEEQKENIDDVIQYICNDMKIEDEEECIEFNTFIYSIL